MKGIKRGIAAALLGIALSIGAGCSTGDALSTPSFYRPAWAPPYADGVRYYYLPDLEIYYDAYTGNYVYWDGFGWSYASRLPAAYRYYDLYNANIVLLDTRIHDPWLYHHHYTSRYPGGYYYYGPRTNSARGHRSRVYNENEGRAELPAAPRGINPSQPAPERTVPGRQQDAPGLGDRPQIRTAPQRAPQSSPRVNPVPQQRQPIQQAPQQNRAPSSAPKQLPRPGGKG